MDPLTKLTKVLDKLFHKHRKTEQLECFKKVREMIEQYVLLKKHIQRIFNLFIMVNKTINLVL